MNTKYTYYEHDTCCKYLKIRYRINCVRIYYGKKMVSKVILRCSGIVTLFRVFKFLILCMGFFVFGYPLPKSHFNNDPKFWLVKKKATTIKRNHGTFVDTVVYPIPNHCSRTANTYSISLFVSFGISACL